MSGMEQMLLQQAGALDADADAMTNPQAADMPQAANDDEGEIRGVLELAGAMLGTVYPVTGQTITAKAPAMAAAAVPVMQKYGWSAGGIFAKFGPEIGMAVIWLPAGLEIARAIRLDKATKAANDEADEQAAEDGGQPQ